MWCIGRITEEYRQRMYDLLALYARPYDRREPVICVDEKSKQLLEDTRPVLPGGCGVLLKEDYEYRRAGTCNLFVAVEPQGGQRQVQVTAQRTKHDFWLIRCMPPPAASIWFSTTSPISAGSIVEVLSARQAKAFLRRVEFHYTPKHASWLNMAEIEIGILDRQCIGRRIAHAAALAADVAAWQQRRNAERQRIEWRFTRPDADRKLGRRYVA